MKKLCLFLMAVLGISMLNAQTLSVTYNDEPVGEQVAVTINPDASMNMAFFEITNNTTDSLTFKVVMQVNQMGEGNKAQICVGDNCLDTNVSEPVGLAAEDVFSDFDILYRYANVQPAQVTISLVNADNEEEVYKSFVVNYSVDASITQSEIVSSLKINATPNPANTVTYFRYAIPSKYKDAKLLVRSPLGSIIKQIPLKVGVASSKISFSTSDLTNGVYFYAVVANGQTLMTKKLIVKH